MKSAPTFSWLSLSAFFNPLPQRMIAFAVAQVQREPSTQERVVAAAACVMTHPQGGRAAQ